VGVSIIASFTLAYVAIANGRVETAILLVALAGSSLGFLPYNFNPAKVFMGDTGSLFLGYILGVISILGAVKGATTLAYIVPILALGLPIFDTSFAILRRYLTNKPIMEADRGHLHHKLLDIGFEHKSAVLILYLISILLGIAAVFFSLNRVLDVILVLTLVVFMITVPINKSTDIEK
jgi:UDP-GlcNAc:undecaprenyl-phosphate GlcNAc-1-phosphate transferase